MYQYHWGTGGISIIKFRVLQAAVRPIHQAGQRGGGDYITVAQP